MSTALKHDWWISPEEYLAGEELAACKHEYVDGVVYAMAGATNGHNRICMSICVSLGSQLVGRPCQPSNSDTKLRIRLPTHVKFYYPDAMVICRENPVDVDYEDEPAVIFEVLSPSTQRADRGEKLEAYRSIPSLQAYVMVESEHIGLTVHRRTEEGWKVELLSNLTDTLELSAIGCRLALEAIYARSGLLASSAAPSSPE
jgi:Uma2 family endonuclease